jgi:hypothetical protein
VISAEIELLTDELSELLRCLQSLQATIEADRRLDITVSSSRLTVS